VPRRVVDSSGEDRFETYENADGAKNRFLVLGHLQVLSMRMLRNGGCVVRCDVLFHRTDKSGDRVNDDDVGGGIRLVFGEGIVDHGKATTIAELTVDSNATVFVAHEVQIVE
jgi:hypothetical protein